MNEKPKRKGKTGFEEQETVAVSPWLLPLTDELGKDEMRAYPVGFGSYPWQKDAARCANPDRTKGSN